MIIKRGSSALTAIFVAITIILIFAVLLYTNSTTTQTQEQQELTERIDFSASRLYTDVTFENENINIKRRGKISIPVEEGTYKITYQTQRCQNPKLPKTHVRRGERVEYDALRQKVVINEQDQITLIQNTNEEYEQKLYGESIYELIMLNNNDEKRISLKDKDELLVNMNQGLVTFTYSPKCHDTALVLKLEKVLN